MEIINILKKFKLSVMFCSLVLACINWWSPASSSDQGSTPVLVDLHEEKNEVLGHIQAVIDHVKNEVFKEDSGEDVTFAIRRYVGKSLSMLLKVYDAKISHLTLSDRIFFYATLFSKGVEALLGRVDANNPQNVHTFDVLSEEVCDSMMSDPGLAFLNTRVLDGSKAFNAGVLDEVCKSGDEDAYLGIVAMYKAFQVADMDSKLNARINFLANLSGYIICKEKEHDKDAITLMPSTIAENVATQGGCVNGYITRMLEILSLYGCVSDPRLRDWAFPDSVASRFSNEDVSLREAISNRPEIEQFMSPDKFALKLLKVALKNTAKLDEHVGALEYAMMYRDELEQYWKMNIGDAISELTLKELVQGECGNLKDDKRPIKDFQGDGIGSSGARLELSKIVDFLIDKNEIPTCHGLSNEELIDKIIDELVSRGIENINPNVNMDAFGSLSRAFISNMLANYYGTDALDRYLGHINCLIANSLKGNSKEEEPTNTVADEQFAEEGLVKYARNDILQLINAGLVNKESGPFAGCDDQTILNKVLSDLQESRFDALYRDMDGEVVFGEHVRDFYEALCANYISERDLLEERLAHINLLLTKRSKSRG